MERIAMARIAMAPIAMVCISQKQEKIFSQTFSLYTVVFLFTDTM